MKGVEEDEGMKEELLFVPAEEATLISNTSRRPKPVEVSVTMMMIIIKAEVMESVTTMIRLESEVGG